MRVSCVHVPTRGHMCACHAHVNDTPKEHTSEHMGCVTLCTCCDGSVRVGVERVGAVAMEAIVNKMGF